jgi:hypothetical protein
MPMPIATLKIAAPYELRPVDPRDAAWTKFGIEMWLGDLERRPRIGLRQVLDGSEVVGGVVVIEFPGSGLAGKPDFLDSMAEIMAGESSEVTKTTILGVPVRLAAGAFSHGAVYERGEGVVLVAGLTRTDATAVATALIKASE